jgi:hypothetical protein
MLTVAQNAYATSVSGFRSTQRPLDEVTRFDHKTPQAKIADKGLSKPEKAATLAAFSGRG